MKILFLSSYYPPRTRGGAEISTHLIAQGLSARGHNVGVVTEGEREERLTYEGVRLHQLPLGLTKKPLYEKGSAKRVASYLRVKIHDLEAYDVVHAQDFRSALALAQLELPQSVVTVRDYWPISGSTNYVLSDGTIGETCRVPGVFMKNPRVQEARGLRKIARVWQYCANVPFRREAYLKLPRRIFISHAQRQLIEGVLPAHSSDVALVIYNPAMPEYLTASIQPGHNGEVVYIGRVEFYKGVSLLIQAWHEVVQKVGGVHLTIIGDGAQRDHYLRAVSRLGLRQQVTFHGRVSHHSLQAYYDKAQVVVSPHIWVEPFGRVVADAMARGKIVVAADAGGPKEMITHGESGLLFTRNSEDSLVKNLTEALTLPLLQRRAMQQKAREWVSANLQIDHVAHAHEKFYTSLA